jgi:hypothetical protein
VNVEAPILAADTPIEERKSLGIGLRGDQPIELQRWYEGKHGGKAGRFNAYHQPFKRRALTTRRQGGIITTAAMMTMNATTLRTHPIKRGAWVATVVFNDPPDPPPDAVGEIEADDKAIAEKGLTLRQRLKQHSDKASCRACHAKIDPLGFVMENYDSVGLWRDKYHSDLPIDATGKIFGDKQYKDIIGFKDALLSKPERFTSAIAEHMLSYALGRELRISDRPAVEKIVDQVEAGQGKMSALVVAITQSRPFLHKTNQALVEKRVAKQGEHK